MILRKDKVLELIDKNGVCVIPDCYTEICDSAFYNCKLLKDVIIPNSITEIGNTAFRNCESLEKVIIPDYLKIIGHYAFENCTSLKEIKIPNSVTKIGENAFYNCTLLKKITIPESVNKIGINAFGMCTLLPKLGVGKMLLEKILEDAYFEEGLLNQLVTLISRLKLVTNIDNEIPLSSIECSAENYCEVNNPKNCKWFALLLLNIINSNIKKFDKIRGNYYICRDNNSQNSNFKIYTYYGNEFFIDNESKWIHESLLTDIMPLNENTALSVDTTTYTGIDYIYENTTRITKENTLDFIDENGVCVIPEGYIKINKGAFIGNQDLKKVILPKSIEIIDDVSFYTCLNLETVIFLGNSNIHTIGDSAFSGCKSLKTINIPKTIEKIDESAFFICPSLPKLGIGRMLLEKILDGDYFNVNLESQFNKIISELKLPTNIENEIPIFTRENAIKHCNGNEYNDMNYKPMFNDKKDAKNFVLWMKDNIEESKNKIHFKFQVENHEFFPFDCGVDMVLDKACLCHINTKNPKDDSFLTVNEAKEDLIKRFNNACNKCKTFVNKLEAIERECNGELNFHIFDELEQGEFYVRIDGFNLIIKNNL